MNRSLKVIIQNKLISSYSLTNVRNSIEVRNRVIENSLNWGMQIFERMIQNSTLLFGRLSGTEATCPGIYLDSKHKRKNPIRYLNL